MGKFIINNKYILLLILISLVVYYRWISFGIFTDGDYDIYFAKELADYPFNYIWQTITNFGAVDFTIWRYLFSYLQSFFASIGYGTNISEKVLLFWPTIVLGNIFSFLLVKKVLKSEFGAFVGAIVFNYNTYYFVISSQILIYAAAPWAILALLAFMRGIENRKLHWFVLTGLSLFLTSVYDFRVAYMAIFLLFFYLFYHVLVITTTKKEYISLAKSSLKIVSPFIIFGLLNVYWVLPMFKMGSVTSNRILDRELFGNELLNILYSINLHHPFWTGSTPAWFSAENISLQFWLIPLIAFLGLTFSKKNKQIFFFGLLSLVGIFLTKQAGEPFPNFYNFLFEYLPGFNAFREASKFYFLISIGYSVLIGAFVVFVVQKIDSRRTWKAYSLLLLIIFLFLWNTKPIMTGEIKNIFTPKDMPPGFEEINAITTGKNENFRHLWIPRRSSWTMTTVNNPSVSMEYILMINDHLESYIDAFRPPKTELNKGEILMKALDYEHFSRILNVSSIRYVIVPPSDRTRTFSYYPDYLKDRKYYIDVLDQVSYLNKIIHTDFYTIYENQSYRPKIYITSVKETIFKNVNFRTVNFSRKNPTQYNLTVDNISDPFYLHFSERYHPDWKIYSGGFSWFDVFDKKSENYVPDGNHSITDAGLNSFYIDPNDLCNKPRCEMNEDGTYNINLTLYFLPQAHLYIGGIVSLITFSVVLIYLSIVFGEASRRTWRGK